MFQVDSCTDGGSGDDHEIWEVAVVVEVVVAEAVARFPVNLSHATSFA